MAFCAIIARFRPHLLDYAQLNKEDSYANSALAFHIGEKYLGVPALLDARDMVEVEQLDKLSIITYLAQLYHKFSDQVPQPARRISLDKDESSDRMGYRCSDSGNSSSSSRQSSPSFSSPSAKSSSKYNNPCVSQDKKPRLSPALSNIQEVESRAKVFSYLNNYQAGNYQTENPQNVPTEILTDIHAIKYDESSDNNPIKRKLMKHRSYESLIENKSSMNEEKSTFHKNNHKSKNANFVLALEKFNKFAANNKSESVPVVTKAVTTASAQTEDSDKPVERVSQSTQTIICQNYTNNIRTASSSSISALYNNSKEKARSDDSHSTRGANKVVHYTQHVQRVPNCDKTYPSSILKGMRRYGDYPHILGYYPRNNNYQNRWASCDQLNIASTIKELSTLV